MVTFRKKASVSSRDVAPQTKSVRAVDVGRITPSGFQRTGGFTIASSSGGGSRVSSVSGEVSQAQAQALQQKQQLAQQKKIEQQIKQKEQAEQQQEIQKATQEQIFSQTIKGQISGKQDKNIFQKTGGGLKDFFFTKPDITSDEFKDKGVVGKGVEFFKFGAFQPIAGIAQEFKSTGKKVKEEDFTGSKVVGTTIGGVGAIIPETPAGQILTAGGVKLLSLSAPVVRTGAGAFFGTSGTIGALDTSSTPEERVGSGIIGGLGFSGVAFETIPFAKGVGARFSTKFKSVKGESVNIGGEKVDAKFISDLGFDGGTGKIGIIPEGGGIKQANFPAGGGALARGGFGFKPSEQIKGFGGKDLRLTTSQRGLKEVGGEFKADPEISELGFFFSPADPVSGIAQTRISRLGLKDFFKRPKGEDISFSLTGGGRPQIIVTEKTPIITTGRTGTGGKARISPKGSTELEATSLSNIEVIENLGVTSLKGQKVDIILGRLTGKGITGEGLTGKGAGGKIDFGFKDATSSKTGFTDLKIDISLGRSGGRTGRGGGSKKGDVISSTSKKFDIPITSPISGSLGLSNLVTNFTKKTSSKTGGLSKGQGSSFPTTNLGSPDFGIPTGRGGGSGGLSTSRELKIPAISFGTSSLDIRRFERPKQKKVIRRGTGDKKPTKKPKTKRRARVKPLRPGFTAIIQSGGLRAKGGGREFENPVFASKGGVNPFSLRGTRTGLAPPRKTKKKSTKKKTAKRKSKRSFGFTNL